MNKVDFKATLKFYSVLIDFVFIFLKDLKKKIFFYENVR